MFLSIIIVNWNGRELLERCLASILALPPSCSYEVVIVDNASTDGSREWLETRRAQLGGKLRFILNDENVGFGRANNQAMRSSRADLFMLLNPDAEPTENSFNALIDVLESDPAIGVVGPRLIADDGSTEPSVWRSPPAFWETPLTGLRLYKLVPRRWRSELLLGQFWPHTEQRDVTFVNGAAMLIRRDVFDRVGGFDEDFFMYGEDMEYSLRISRAGWRLVFTPSADVRHSRSRSSIRRWGDEKVRIQTLGYLKFYDKSLSKRQVLMILGTNIAVFRLEALLRSLRGIDRGDLDLRLNIYEAAFRQRAGRALNFRLRDRKPLRG